MNMTQYDEASKHFPTMSPWLKANRKKPRAATVFGNIKYPKYTPLSQTYANVCTSKMQ